METKSVILQMSISCTKVAVVEKYKKELILCTEKVKSDKVVMDELELLFYFYFATLVLYTKLNFDLLKCVNKTTLENRRD